MFFIVVQLHDITDREKSSDISKLKSVIAIHLQIHTGTGYIDFSNPPSIGILVPVI
jgi:hypothetical protein